MTAGSDGAGAQTRRPSVQKRTRSERKKKNTRSQHVGVRSADQFLIRIHFGYLAADQVQGAGQGFSALSMPQSRCPCPCSKKRVLEPITQFWVGRGSLVLAPCSPDFILPVDDAVPVEHYEVCVDMVTWKAGGRTRRTPLPVKNGAHQALREGGSSKVLLCRERRPWLPRGVHSQEGWILSSPKIRRASGRR